MKTTLIAFSILSSINALAASNIFIFSQPQYIDIMNANSPSKLLVHGIDSHGETAVMHPSCGASRTHAVDFTAGISINSGINYYTSNDPSKYTSGRVGFDKKNQCRDLMIALSNCTPEKPVSLKIENGKIEIISY